MESPHGVVSLLKPPGMTSHDAVAHIRRVLKTKRVGHTGTLDPAACGVLPICVGQATRLVEALQGGTKTYLAEATFGFETDTLDAVGQIVHWCDASALDINDVERVLAQFRGTIEQQPPLYSAIKVDGRKLYDIARQNESDDRSAETASPIEIPRRLVEVSSLSVTRFFPATAAHPHPRALMRVECSGGTYIRSLVRDIGRALDGAATMTFLTRVTNGLFALSDSVTPQEFEQTPVLTSVPRTLERLYGAALYDDKMVADFSQGRRVSRSVTRVEDKNDDDEEQFMLWSNRQNTLLALTIAEGGQWRPIKVFDLR